MSNAPPEYHDAVLRVYALRDNPELELLLRGMGELHGADFVQDDVKEKTVESLFRRYEQVSRDDSDFARVWNGDTTFVREVNLLPEITARGVFESCQTYANRIGIGQRARLEEQLALFEDFYEREELLGVRSEERMRAMMREFSWVGAAVGYGFGTMAGVLSVAALSQYASSPGIVWNDPVSWVFMAGCLIVGGHVGRTFEGMDAEMLFHQPLKSMARVADDVVGAIHRLARYTNKANSDYNNCNS